MAYIIRITNIFKLPNNVQAEIGGRCTLSPRPARSSTPGTSTDGSAIYSTRKLQYIFLKLKSKIRGGGAEVSFLDLDWIEDMTREPPDFFFIRGVR